MRLLHVSDLHACSDQALDQREILVRAIDDIVVWHEERAFDAVVFSGDLAHAGVAAEFSLGRQTLLEPLAERLSLDRDRIFLVPGNHDVCREDINTYEDKGLRAALTGDTEVNGLLDDANARSGALKRLQQWAEFETSYYEGVTRTLAPSLGWTAVIPLDGRQIGFACLCSSWRSYGGEDDRHRVLLGERQLGENLAAVGESVDLRIVTFHHPLSWLPRWDESTARQHLEAHPTIVLTGHDHEADPSNERTTRGGAIYGRCGCLYETKQFANSFSIVDVDFDQAIVRFSMRTWYPKRRAFAAAINVTPDGSIEYDLPAKPGVQVAVARRYSEVVDVITSNVLDQSVIADHLPGHEARSLDELLVAPRFFPIPYREAVAAQRVDEDRRIGPLDMATLVRSARVLIVNGDQQSGVSNALLWLQAQAFASDSTHVPVYVQFDRRFKKSRFERAVRLGAGSVLRTAGKGALPPLLLAVDDVKAESSSYCDAFAAYIAEHPEHRFLLGTHGDDHLELEATLRAREISVDSAFLGPFATRQVRDLISKLADGRETLILQRAFELIGLAHLPRTPFIMATLVVVLAQQQQLAALNESGLLDTYVTVLLSTGPGGAFDDEAMDPKRREYFLSWFAGLLTQRAETRMRRVDAEAALLEKFRQFGWGTASSPGSVIENLIQRRVLSQDEVGVGFRLRGLQDFFAAKYMNSDPAFAEFVLADVLAYNEIVRHSAGLTRTNRELLSRVGDISKRTVDAIDLEVQTSMFDKIGERPGWSREEPDVDRLRRQLSALDQTASPAQSQLDERLDEMYDAIESGSEEGSAPPEPDDIDRMLLAISTLSSVLRSSELVDDLDLKERLLKEALHGWGLTAILWAVREDDTHGVVDVVRSVLPVRQDVPGAEDAMNRMAELLTTVLLTLVMRAELGSVHMEDVIRSTLNDEEFMSETVHALLATVLYVELRLPGWPDRLARLRQQHGAHPLVGELTRVTALLAYRLGGPLTREDRKKLENLLVEIHSPPVSARGQAAPLGRNAVRSEVLDLLRKSQRQQHAEQEIGPLDELDEVDETAERTV